MQGVVTGFGKDTNGYVISISMYTDDVALTNGVPPAGVTPYVIDTLHVALGSTLAQANVAATAAVTARAQEHAGLANIATQVLGHVIMVAG